MHPTRSKRGSNAKKPTAESLTAQFNWQGAYVRRFHFKTIFLTDSSEDYEKIGSDSTCPWIARRGTESSEDARIKMPSHKLKRW